MAGVPAKEAERYGPYRAAAWGLYTVFAVIFSLAITVNVVRSTLAMTPKRPPAAVSLLDPAQCTSAARALWSELDARRKMMSEARPVRAVDVTWTHFRIDWLIRAHEAESRCTGDNPDRKPQKAIFKKLNTLMDLYTTHAVQFAGEVGPTLDDLTAELDAAK